MRGFLLTVSVAFCAANAASAADLCAPLSGTSAYSRCLSDQLVATGRDLSPIGTKRDAPLPVSTPEYTLQRDEAPAPVHDPDFDRQQAEALEQLRKLTDYRTRRLADQVSRDNGLRTLSGSGGGLTVQADPLAHRPTR